MPRRIYTCYSPSHTPLLERHFLPSIPEGFDVVLRKHDQVCLEAKYGTSDWNKATLNKIPLILEAIEQESSPFIFSDVDIRFYNFTPFDLDREMTGTYDLKCQDDQPSFCTGLMFIRPSPIAHHLFQLVLDSTLRFADDQHAFNLFALPKLKEQISISKLPLNRYWSIGPDFANWDKTDPPPNLATHHANWVQGVEAKMKFLDLVHAKQSKIVDVS